MGRAGIVEGWIHTWCHDLRAQHRKVSLGLDLREVIEAAPAQAMAGEGDHRVTDRDPGAEGPASAEHNPLTTEGENKAAPTGLDPVADGLGTLPTLHLSYAARCPSRTNAGRRPTGSTDA